MHIKSMKRNRTIIIALLFALICIPSIAYYRMDLITGSKPIMGITYASAIICDSPETVTQELTLIAERGYKIVRSWFCLDWNLSTGSYFFNRFAHFCDAAHTVGLQTYLFFMAPLGYLEFTVVQQWRAVLEDLVSRLADRVDYWQILNEIDALEKGDGNAHMATELVNAVKVLAKEVREHDPTSKIVVTFTQLFLARPDLLLHLGELKDTIDYVGLDVYEDGRSLSQIQIGQLQASSGKPVIITETGTSTQDVQAKESWMRQTVTYFSGLACSMIIVFEWKDSLYATKDTDLIWDG